MKAQPITGVPITFLGFQTQCFMQENCLFVFNNKPITVAVFNHSRKNTPVSLWAKDLSIKQVATTQLGIFASQASVPGPVIGHYFTGSLPMLTNIADKLIREQLFYYPDGEIKAQPPTMFDPFNL